MNGVLGQTHIRDYMSRVKMGASMLVMGRERDYETSSLFATNSVVAECKKTRLDSNGEATLEGL